MAAPATPAPLRVTPVGTARPGGRAERIRVTVLDAVIDVLVTDGVRAVTVASVAGRAGVSRSTIYRRWPGIGALISDALYLVTDDALPVRDTGDLRVDLRQVARRVVDMLSDPRRGALVRVLVAATDDEQLGQIAARYWARRAELVRPRIRAAIRAGELPSTARAEQVIETIAAPLLFRFLVARQPLRRRDADRAVDHFLRTVHHRR